MSCKGGRMTRRRESVMSTGLPKSYAVVRGPSPKTAGVRLAPAFLLFIGLLTAAPASVRAGVFLLNGNFEDGFSAAGGSFGGVVGTGWTAAVYSGTASNFTYA